VLTVCAAAIVLVCSVLWPVRRSREVCRDLRGVARALQAFLAALPADWARSGDELGRATAQALEARIVAEQAIVVASHEPGAHRLLADDARAILLDFTALYARLRALEVTDELPSERSSLPVIQVDLERLAGELTALRDTGRVGATEPDDPDARLHDPALRNIQNTPVHYADGSHGGPVREASAPPNACQPSGGSVRTVCPGGCALRRGAIPLRADCRSEAASALAIR
jgi:hypothetical protein